MDKSSLYILLNSFLYILTLIYYQRKKSKIEIGTILLSTFTISSISSIFFYSLPIIPLVYNNISLLPFLYLYTAIMFTLYPVLKFESSNIKYISPTGQINLIKYISIFIILISIDSALENLVGVLQTGFSTSGNTYGSIYEGDIDSARHLSFIGKKTNYIVLMLTPLNISFFYYYLSKKNIKYALWMLTPIISVFLWGIASANRGSLISNFLLFIAGFFIFRSLLPIYYRKKIILFLTISVSAMIGFTLIITFSRFYYSGGSMYDNPFEWLLLYLGEGFLRFNQIAWNNDFFMNGDNCFGTIKEWLGIYAFDSRLSCTNYYDIKIGAQIETFYTYIGDFVLDFGIYFSIIIYVGLYWISKKVFANRENLPFEYMPLMIALLKMLLIGFTANIYRGGITMLVVAITYFLIGRIARLRAKKIIE